MQSGDLKSVRERRAPSFICFSAHIICEGFVIVHSRPSGLPQCGALAGAILALILRKLKAEFLINLVLDQFTTFLDQRASYFHLFTQCLKAFTKVFCPVGVILRKHLLATSIRQVVHFPPGHGDSAVQQTINGGANKFPDRYPS